MAGSFKDHFSGHAAAYAQARPTYPAELYAWLAGLCHKRDRAWDCATGNGQAARGLGAHFAQVIATDASETQLASATATDGVRFHAARAERSGLATGSVDLVTVAQALHWFDLADFFAEAGRVLKPGGVLAAWCYGVCQVSADTDRLVHKAYDALGPWWPPERIIVERGYSDIEFPWPLLEAPVFAMTMRWDAGAMLAYLDTWSATQRCRAATGNDPLAVLRDELPAAWGTGVRTVTWPLFIRACRAPH